MLAGNSPGRRYKAPNRRGLRAEGRGGYGESHRSTRGRRDGAETAWRRRTERLGVVVAEGGDARSGRLGVASNGPRLVRRSSGRLHLRRRGSQRRLDDDPRMRRWLDERERESSVVLREGRETGARGGCLYGGGVAREGDSEAVGGGADAESWRGENGSARRVRAGEPPGG